MMKGLFTLLSIALLSLTVAACADDKAASTPTDAKEGSPQYPR